MANQMHTHTQNSQKLLGFKDELSINNDLLMKGEWVVIPTVCRDSIMEDLHLCHAGINKAMSLARTCMYWPGMEADITDYIKRCLTCIDSSNLPVETLHLPRSHQDLGSKWEWTFSKMTLERCNWSMLTISANSLLSTQLDHLIISRPSHIFENSSLQKAFQPLWCLTMALHSMETTSRILQESLTLGTQLLPLTSTSQMVSLRPWWRKVKHAYKKTDGSPTAQAWALLQLCDTPIAADLPSPAENSTWETPKVQSSQDIQSRSTWRDLVEIDRIQDAQKQQFDRAHRAKDLWVLNMNKQVCFFPNKQGMGGLIWLTGTVSEILDCGHSYMITGPNGRVYRKTELTWNLFAMMAAHSRTVPKQRRTKNPKLTLFKTPRRTAKRWKPCCFSQTQQTLWLEPWSLIYKMTIIHHIHHHVSTTHPDHPCIHPPPIICSIQGSSVEPDTGGSHTWRQGTT